MEAVDNTTLRVTLTKPSPFFLNTLAGTWTKVQAPEAVDKFEADYAKYNADQIIGTGDFVLTKFTPDGDLQFRRFDKAPRQSNWDGIDFVPLFTDINAQKAAFQQGQIDAFDPRQQAIYDELMSSMKGKIYSQNVFFPNPILMTWFGGAAPWNDQRLPGAIQQALDRRSLVQQFAQGNGAMTAYIPPAWAPYALPEKDLVNYAGYIADRTKDETDARARWLAGGGDKLGEVVIDIPDIFEGSYSGFASVVTKKLTDVLGTTFTPKIEPYATITAKIVGQQYGNGKANTWFGWGNPPSDPDTTLTITNAFNSKSSQWAQWSVNMPEIDGMVDAMENEFDTQKRIALNHEAQKHLLKYDGGGIQGLFVTIAQNLYWNYYKAGEITHQVTVQNYGQDWWFDQKDPSWASRKA
ncbi:MAG: hypothetical protein IT303_12555 [Dehalococcoidia bacterium]|nr:hypothetical protein [Dehalococcoidia bacterium]